MHYDTKQYKDGQVTATITEQGDLDVKIRGNSYTDLFEAASIKEAWDAQHIQNKNRQALLTIYCLIGQRSDRRFHPGASFDLKVIAGFINGMHYDEVRILHPHSDVTLALIDRSVKIDPAPYVQQALQELDDPVLISPDAGAYKTTHAIAEKLQTDLIPANKVRVAGEPQITIQGEITGKVCLIVDDMADGGRTFHLLAQALKAQGAHQVYLYVTHGQFHYGFDELTTYIDHIYCTNSCRDICHEFVTQFQVVE